MTDFETPNQSKNWKYPLSRSLPPLMLLLQILTLLIFLLPYKMDGIHRTTRNGMVWNETGPKQAPKFKLNLSSSRYSHDFHPIST